MTLYADILFAVNFLMNSFVLYGVARVLRSTRKRRWWLAGALLMALLYTLILAIAPLRGVNLILAQGVILVAGVWVAFFPRGIWIFVKHILAAYIITFVIGGLGMALFFLTDLPYAVHYIASDLGAFSRSISIWVAVVGTVLSYVLIKAGAFFINRHNMKKQVLCPVKITMDELSIDFQALVDTGHSLREPLSNAPVIVAEFERVKPFLPEGLCQLFYEKKESNLTDLLLGQENVFYTRLRLIPFKSIGRTNGMLVGFRPDKVTVQDEATKKAHADIIIGIFNDKLTRDGRYQGLLSAELVN